MKTLALPTAFCAFCALAACADPPLLEAPGAVAVGVARTADAIALWETLGRAHLVDTAVLKGASPMLVADAPIIVSALPSGALIVATRVGGAGAGAAALSASAVPVLGGTNRVVVGGVPVLVRADKNRVLVALRVKDGDESTVAALLELMATSKDDASGARVTPPLPAPGEVHLRIAGASLPVALGDVDANLTVRGDVVTLKATALHPSDDVRAAFQSAPPPGSCALAKGAAALLAIPPMFVGEDSFRGRVVVAVYAPSRSAGVSGGSSASGDGKPAFAFLGTPKDHAAAVALGDAVRSAAPQVLETADGTRRLFQAGALHAVVDDATFLLTSGALPPSAPCEGPSALVTVRGADLARVVGPAFVSPKEIMRALVSGDASAAEPLAQLAGIDRFDADVAVDGTALAFTATLALAPAVDVAESRKP